MKISAIIEAFSSFRRPLYTGREVFYRYAVGSLSSFCHFSFCFSQSNSRQISLTLYSVINEMFLLSETIILFFLSECIFFVCPIQFLRLVKNSFDVYDEIKYTEKVNWWDRDYSQDLLNRTVSMIITFWRWFRIREKQRCGGETPVDGLGSFTISPDLVFHQIKFPWAGKRRVFGNFYCPEATAIYRSWLICSATIPLVLPLHWWEL